MKASVIIRTYNESRHLPELLLGIAEQDTRGIDVEVVVVDSGSTDGTVQIAQRHDVKLVTIQKNEFTFGRSLNIGCAAATGEVFVMVSGHCRPVDKHWIANLVQPLLKNVASYSYGRQHGDGTSHFSELQIFNKYFPERSAIPQEGFFVNNANSALLKSVWREHRFNEDLSGLEDMELGKRLLARGHKIAYVADAGVYHLHEESWQKVRTRYEREALALQSIMPEVQVTMPDFLRYYASAIFHDASVALQERQLSRRLPSILAFRLAQFWGTYRGNHEHRKLSQAMKERYFYPR